MLASITRQTTPCARSDPASLASPAGGSLGLVMGGEMSKIDLGGNSRIPQFHNP
jgi:hypothetical protein